jgi:hypothetical protein
MNEGPKEGVVEAVVAGALTSPGLDDLATDYAELGLDGIIDSDVVSEIPVVKSLVSVVRMGIGIRDRLFARKLFNFLIGFRGINDWERRDMVSRLEADPEYGRRVGEHLTELLDRIETVKKPLMVARVFRAYANKVIDATMLHRLCSTIERLPAFEIGHVTRFRYAPVGQSGLPLESVANLQTAGLIEVGWTTSGMYFSPNEVAKMFVTLELDNV